MAKHSRTDNFIASYQCLVFNESEWGETTLFKGGYADYVIESFDAPAERTSHAATDNYGCCDKDPCAHTFPVYRYDSVVYFSQPDGNVLYVPTHNTEGN